MSNITGTGAWGASETQFFFELTPDRVLDAVETAGLRCTGRCVALGSYENRVYDVELELDDGAVPKNASEMQASRRVIKFYRPGRWTEAQILEEHEFLADLREAEIPVICPLPFPDGRTLHYLKSGIAFTVFPKVGGRAPEEMPPDQLRQIGRLLARIHQVGAKKAAPNRIELNASTYGRENLKMLLDANHIPLEFKNRYEKAVQGICEIAERGFAALAPGAIHRVHGDCHLGNLLWTPAGPFFLDFDDMVRAPAVQDLWLLVPGRDPESAQNRMHLLEGYEEMRHFDYASLKLIEPLRALRFIHYSAWIARRWDDPAFPLAFPHFGSHRYWADETHDMEEQLRLSEASAQAGSQPTV